MTALALHLHFAAMVLGAVPTQGTHMTKSIDSRQMEMIYFEYTIPTLAMTWWHTLPTALAPSCKIQKSGSTINQCVIWKHTLEHNIWTSDRRRRNLRKK
jgi:hypothetical protein